MGVGQRSVSGADVEVRGSVLEMSSAVVIGKEKDDEASLRDHGPRAHILQSSA
jgi:hypothetical protein